MCECIRAIPHAGDLLQLAKAPGCRVALHPPAFAVEQKGPAAAARDGAVDRASDSGRHGHEHHLGALAEDADDAVAVFLTEVVDVEAGGFHDAQPE